MGRIWQNRGALIGGDLCVFETASLYETASLAKYICVGWGLPWAPKWHLLFGLAYAVLIFTYLLIVFTR